MFVIIGSCPSPQVGHPAEGGHYEEDRVVLRQVFTGGERGLAHGPAGQGPGVTYMRGLDASMFESETPEGYQRVYQGTAIVPDPAFTLRAADEVINATTGPGELRNIVEIAGLPRLDKGG
jgi:hypothetical protein